jgi:hypothetical protein
MSNTVKTKVEFEIELPKGYEFVRYGLPKEGEQYLSDDNNNVFTASSDFDYALCIIVRKTQPTGKDLVGALCYVWDEEENNEQVDVIVGYRDGDTYPYDTECNEYRNAKPLTPAEVQVYLDKAKELEV